MLIKALYRGANVLEVLQQRGFSARLVNGTITPEPKEGDIVQIESEQIKSNEIDGSFFLDQTIEPTETVEGN